MWDTAPARFRAMAPGAPAGADGSIDPVPVRHAVGIRASRAQATVTLTPSTTTLAGRPVNYPLYIDPQINETSAQYYSQVGTIAGPWNTTTGTTSQPNGVMEIGFCGYDGNFPVPCVWNRQIQFFTDRAFFRMDTSVLEPNSGFRPSIYSASFAPHEVYNSATCTAEPIAVWSTSGGISSSTDWPGPQGSQLGTASSAAGGGTGCSNSADVPVDITSYVQAHAQSADAPASMTFEVRAPDETQKLQFKKISDNPTFTVWFSFAPLQPTDLSVQNAVTCTSTTYTSLARPILSARGVDNNPAFEDLFHTISLYDSSGSLVSPTTGATGNGQAQNGGRHSGDPQSTNVRGQWAPGSDLSDGQAYHFTDQTQNLPGINDQTPPRNSPVADPYYFTVLTASLAAPSVTSFDYPVDASGQAYWGQPQGAPGVFTVGTNGAAHIAGFAYSFDGGSASEPVPSTTDCNYLHDGGLGTAQGTGGFGTSTGERALVHGSTAQIQAPASLAAGRHTLWVTSFDLAHNASGETPYVFYVAPNYQSASQPRKTYLPDDLFGSAGGPNLSLLGEQNLCCGMTTWPGDNQLFFQSTAINQSYSVTVNVPAAGTWQLGADMTTASDYGKVRFDLDGANLGGTASTPFDGYTASVSSQYVDLGTQALTAGAHTLAVKVTDQNAELAGFKSGLIYLTLSPTNRYEADTLPHGGAAPQCFGLSAWENNCQLFFANTTPGASFTVTFPAPVESDYALGVNLTKASDYGTLEFVLDPGTATQFVLDGTDPHSNPPGNPVDAHASPTTAQYVFLGGVHLAQGPHVLQVIVTGTSSTTGNLYNAGINYVAAAPVTGATTSSFTAAMNNLGVATDNSPSLAQNFDLTSSATGSNLSRDALQAAGITVGTGTGAGAGNTFSLGGAAFTMPPLRTDPVTHAVIGDNVIPDGQIIQVPPVTTSGVALLVTTTCGGSPAASATLGYSAARNDNPVIPAVSNWKSGPTNVAVMQLGHYDSGSNSTPASTAQPRLYEVMLPANPSFSADVRHAAGAAGQLPDRHGDLPVRGPDPARPGHRLPASGVRASGRQRLDRRVRRADGHDGPAEPGDLGPDLPRGGAAVVTGRRPGADPPVQRLLRHSGRL